MFQNSRAISAINALNVSSASLNTSYIDYSQSNFGEFTGIQSAIANENKFGGYGTDPNVDAALYASMNSEPLFVDEFGRNHYADTAVGKNGYDYERDFNNTVTMQYIC